MPINASDCCDKGPCVNGNLCATHTQPSATVSGSGAPSTSMCDGPTTPTTVDGVYPFDDAPGWPYWKWRIYLREDCVLMLAMGCFSGLNTGPYGDGLYAWIALGKPGLNSSPYTLQKVTDYVRCVAGVLVGTFTLESWDGSTSVTVVLG